MSSEQSAVCKSTPKNTWTAILFLAVALATVGIGASLLVGDVPIPAGTVWDALFHHDSKIVDHLLVCDRRLPRAVADLLVGAALAVAGAIMQAMTRNPLASPGIMGLNTGAGFASIVAIVLLPGVPRYGLLLASIAGAAFGATLVYGLASLSRGGLTPVRLALTGLAVSSLLGALGNGVTIYNQLGQDTLFWFARGTEGVQWSDIGTFLPLGVVGFLGAVAISPAMGVMSLGEHVASSLGQRARLAKFLAATIVLLLAGGAVSLAGSIGFVGLMTPHLVRSLVGWDYRVLIPSAALFGALLVLMADIGARLVSAPFNAPVPVSVVTSLIGVPFFIYLISRRKLAPRGKSL